MKLFWPGRCARGPARAAYRKRLARRSISNLGRAFTMRMVSRLTVTIRRNGSSGWRGFRADKVGQRADRHGDRRSILRQDMMGRCPDGHQGREGGRCGSSRGSRGATLYTDEGRHCGGVDKDRYAVNHGSCEYARMVDLMDGTDGMATANHTESARSILKRSIVGVHHKMPPKHLRRYVRTFVNRWYIRGPDTEDQAKFRSSPDDGSVLDLCVSDGGQRSVTSQRIHTQGTFGVSIGKNVMISKNRV